MAELNPKRFLELEDHGQGLAVTAEPQQAEELQAVFTQRGIPCRTEEAGPGKVRLVFDTGVEREAAVEVLEGYVQAKGS